MAYNVDIYKNGTKLGSGSMTNGSNTVSSFTAVSGRTVNKGRNVQITATSGSNIGQTVNMRVEVDGGSSLTTNHKAPHN